MLASSSCKYCLQLKILMLHNILRIKLPHCIGRMHEQLKSIFMIGVLARALLMSTNKGFSHARGLIFDHTFSPRL